MIFSGTPRGGFLPLHRLLRRERLRHLKLFSQFGLLDFSTQNEKSVEYDDYQVIDLWWQLYSQEKIVIR